MTHEAVYYLISWIRHEAEFRRRLGVRVSVSLCELKPNRRPTLSLDNLIADKELSWYVKGNGFIVLTELCSKASEVRVPVTLVCLNSLTSYYERAGFADMAENGPLFRAMLREP